MSNDLITDMAANVAAEAAARFITADDLVKRAEAARDQARQAVVASFEMAGLQRHAGVIVSHFDRRELDHEAAARIADKVPGLCTLTTSTKRVDACLASKALTPRQYARIVTPVPTVRVEQERTGRTEEAAA